MNVEHLIADNPVLVRYVRSRLRPQHLMAAIIAVGIVAACIVWWADATNTLKDGDGFIGLLVLQGGLLFIVGTSEVGSGVANAKDSGMLDFHRISPQSPLSIAVGFILGAPIREWALFACTLPFSIYAGLASKPALLAALPVMVLAAFLYHSLAALMGAASIKPRGVGAAIILLVIFLHISSTAPGIGQFTIIPTVAQALDPGAHLPFNHTFFAVAAPYPLLALLHQLPLLLFVLIALVRKMRLDRAMLYSKPEAVAFHATIALLLLGNVADVRDPSWPGLAMTVALYGLVGSALILSLFVTPNTGQLAGGLRRARKLGLPSVPLWSDFATNWGPLGAFCAVTLVAGLLTGTRAALDGIPIVLILLATISALATIAQFGSARPYAELQFRKAGQVYLGLFMLVVWILPIPAGYILREAGFSDATCLPVFAISPLSGVALAATNHPQAAHFVALGVGLVLSLALAAAFSALRVQAEAEAARRARQAKS